MTNVEPLKSGNGFLRLEFVKVFADFSPQTQGLNCVVKYRGTETLVAAVHTNLLIATVFAISEIDMDWLTRNCPRLVKRYELAHYNMYYEEPHDAQKFLNAHLGSTEDELVKPSPLASRWAQPMMSQKSIDLAFEHEFTGADAWLLARPLVPNDMDQHWLIHSSERDGSFTLFVRRSWTGLLVYEVAMQRTPDGYNATSARVNLDEAQRGFGTPAEERAHLDWLIGGQLLASVSSLPVTDCTDLNPAKRAWASLCQERGIPVPTWMR